MLKTILKRKSQIFINLKSRINILNTYNKLKGKKSIMNNLKNKKNNNINKRKGQINYPFNNKRYIKSPSSKNIFINKYNMNKRRIKINYPINKKSYIKSPFSKNIIINKYNINKRNSRINYPFNNKRSNKSTCSRNILINKNNIKKRIITNKNELNYNELNEGELNDLIYEIAIRKDKRTYCQYYCSLLKNEHLILFTFIQNNDYNLLSLKFALFILTISSEIAINALFFSDKTMNKITRDEGQFNIIYQIPQIMYTTLISVVINSLLRFFSLSEKNILKLKNENNMKIINGLAIHTKKIIKIKFFIFYFLSNIFLLFFWYFISCFCAVYINTQIILFKDTISSFCVSMIYPFLISLLPGVLRIPALRNSKYNRKCMYKISKILAIL